MSTIVTYDDLSSTVYTDEVPEWAAAELPALYHSFFSTVEYFHIYDEAVAISTCVLENPHHVVMFTVADRRAVVLNKVFDIEPASAARLCETLFRLHPDVGRIRLEVMFEPSSMTFKHRILHQSEDTVIWLPASIEEYRASLNPRVRKDVSYKWRRLVAAHPDAHVEVIEKEAISTELVHSTVEMSRRRMQALGVVSGYDSENERRLLEISHSYGFAVTLAVGGDLAAVAICQEIGEHTLVQVHAYDERFSAFSMGLQVSYFAICEAVRRGRAATHHGWGHEDFKRRLGAVEVPTSTLSVYRSSRARRLALDEVVGLAVLGLRKHMRRLAHPGIRTALRRLSARRHESSSTGPRA